MMKLKEIDTEEEARKWMKKIEASYTSKVCGLRDYRDVLQEITNSLQERINQLDDELRE